MIAVERAVNLLKDNLGEAVQEVITFRDQTTVVLERKAIVNACTLLRDQAEFNFLAALTAVDYWPAEPRFKIVYQLYSLSQKAFLGINVFISGEEAELSTLESVFPNANWHEREIFDMFGVSFEGHSDLRRIIMPYDWQGHPLRKDYPLGYEEVQFTFNFDEIDRRKPYAKK